MNPLPLLRSARLVLLGLALAFTAGAAARAGALEDYVQAPDPTFSWKYTEKKNYTNVVLHHLELVSQTWRGQFWSHHLVVIRPQKVRNPRMALLFVTGGSFNSPSDKDVLFLSGVAEQAGAMIGYLNKVPNQPLFDGRYEDALIAYTFDQYLKGGDATWPLLFPMVKSAVRGMDVLSAYARQQWGEDLNQFVVTGASKRGWTTWLTGAADPRVKAIAPMVIDMLNMKAQLLWAEKVYGKQSEEINDYTEINLHQKQDDPAMARLRGWVDPYEYRSRYKDLPKLLLLGTNDPYWTVDSLRHYWNDLPEPKLVFQTPNAGHDLAGGKDAVATLGAWFQLIADHQPLPTVNWQAEAASPDLKFTVKTSLPAKAFTLWTADSKDRDFRDDKWSSKPIATDQPTTAAVTVEKPASGFRACLIEATFASSTGKDYRLSTEARVLPDEPRK